MPKLGLDRQILASITKNHQAIVALERVFEDVGTTIPDNVSDAQALALDASLSAASAKSGVARLDTLTAALEAFVNTQRAASATISRLEARIADLEVQLTALRRSIDADGLRRQINDIQTLVQAS